MIPKEKNKMNLKILGMLRDKGAPALTPFPGEQGFESNDLDLDRMGDVLVSGTRIGPKEEDRGELPKKPKKKIKVPKEDEDEVDEEGDEDSYPGDL